jgi:uncharacterized protein
MHLTLHLTQACNMRCSYCYAPPHNGEGMSEEVARKALALGSRTSNGSSFGVVFFGGEPLLMKDRIKAIVAHAREMERYQAGRFHFKITTNGVLLDKAFLEFAVRHHVMIGMSFDGIREAHDRHRRFPDGSGTFDLLDKKLRMLLEAKPYASVLMVVNPDTAKHLSESVAYLVDLSCRYLIVSLNYDAGWQPRHFRDLRREYKKLGKLYVKWTQAGRKFYLSPFEVKLSSHINRHCFQKERCELAQRQISVDPQGYLYPCVQFPQAGPDSRWCIGHVDTGIEEAARIRIRETSQREKPECEGCAIRERCNNTCGCLNWQTTGDINRISPVLCEHERMLVPIVDRVGKVLYRRRDPLFLHKHYNAAYPVLSLLEDTVTK